MSVSFDAPRWLRPLTRPLQGISLSLDQYNALMEVLPEVETALAKKGQTVVRPNFEGNAAKDKADEDDDEGSDANKKNFEATSDEDGE